MLDLMQEEIQVLSTVEMHKHQDFMTFYYDLIKFVSNTFITFLNYPGGTDLCDHTEWITEVQ